MSEIESKGKTVSEAIINGLSMLGCKQKDAKIKILSEGTTGLFGLMGAKPAVVLISAEDSKCLNKTVIEIDHKKICKKTEALLENILSKMNVSCHKIETSFKDDTINVAIHTDSNASIIGKNGQTLDSLEYITQTIINKEFGFKLKLNLDIENYRKKQIEKLQIMADKAVEYVNRTGKIYRFDPMSAKERKIIHVYLKDNPTIESFSEGEGTFRKVGIKSTTKKS
jgi:spoIIIJ-associated protein